MSNRKLILLVLLGALSLGAGWHYGPGQSRVAERQAEAGSLVFPGLAGLLAQARTVEIVHQGKSLRMERHEDGSWGLTERDSYPVQTRTLRAILTGLTELRFVEKRTTDPARFARLGVEDPDQPDGTSNLLRVLDSGGKKLAEIVLGHRLVRTQGDLPESVYIRRPHENQVWLAEGRLDVSADPQALISRDILSVPAERIVNVTVSRGQEKLELARDGDRLELVAPAEHPKLDTEKLEEVGRALDGLTLLDVRRASEPAAAPRTGEAVFTAIDGLTVRVTLFHGDKDLWARFAVSGPEAISADVQALEAKLNGWQFRLSPWKEKALLPTLKDLLAPTGDEAPAKP